MRHHLLATAISLAALLTAGQADARQVTITTQLNSFTGPRAYAAVYLTDPSGTIVDTLWVAGGKSKYYMHLRAWSRGSTASRVNLHSVTGASVGSGGKLRVSADIADTMIADGYQIRVDTSVEDNADHPRSAVLTLGQQTSVPGRGFVHTLSLK